MAGTYGPRPAFHTLAAGGEVVGSVPLGVVGEYIASLEKRFLPGLKSTPGVPR